MDKILELAKKLKALADRGIGGEKQNAQIMLERLCQKHGILISDIEGEIVNKYYLTYTNANRDLFFQLLAHVGITEVFSVRRRGSKKALNEVAIYTTVSLYLEFEAKSAFYFREYKKQMDLFYKAFIDANDLYRTTNPISIHDLSEKEKRELWQVAKISEGIERAQFHTQLPESNN